ncbi:MAG: pentapeptide repeat-containing protein, partial [Symploca sp. SIO2E6]|nr:pentapeptide repeat-containing protein [Symploca sp. SIO2E6]
AERLKENLEEWTAGGRKRHKFYLDDEQLAEEIYDLLGYGGLTREIVDYLMALLAASKEFRPVELFERLDEFYLRWCDGEFIDLSQETLPQKKTQQLKDLGIQLGQRQVDIYTGLNVMILLLELHRYALSRDDLKDKIVFYPCGEYKTEGFDETRLLCIIGYSNCIGIDGFFKIVGRFLIGANLSGANLNSANLISANLISANLISADLSSTDLSSANLNSADLSGANLNSANLNSADLSGANLNGADLSGANLIDADLSGANLIDADLSGANFSGADLIDADLSGANLIGANLSGADLSGANLSGANLIGANLIGANLSGVDLIGADLNRANLSRAYLSDTNLSDANLSGANLQNIIWDEDTQWNNILGFETAINVPITLKQKLN